MLAGDEVKLLQHLSVVKLTQTYRCFELLQQDPHLVDANRVKAVLCSLHAAVQVGSALVTQWLQVMR